MPELPASDRRTDARAPIELKVEHKKHNTFFADYTKHICKGGRLIRTRKPLEVGTAFTSKLATPRLKDLPPNAITAASVVFALVAIQHAIAGAHRSAVWWVLLCVLSDKLDGSVARALRASSTFGGQLDSFADFLSFGVAPATIFYG